MSVIDRLNGHMSAMPRERQIALQIHELPSCPNQSGVATFLINPRLGLLGTMAMGNIDIPYMAHVALLIREPRIDACGILTGTSEYVGERGPLLEARDG